MAVALFAADAANEFYIILSIIWACSLLARFVACNVYVLYAFVSRPADVYWIPALACMIFGPLFMFGLLLFLEVRQRYVGVYRKFCGTVNRSSNASAERDAERLDPKSVSAPGRDRLYLFTRSDSDASGGQPVFPRREHRTNFLLFLYKGAYIICHA
jgi:hypothetical protein